MKVRSPFLISFLLLASMYTCAQVQHGYDATWQGPSNPPAGGWKYNFYEKQAPCAGLALADLSKIAPLLTTASFSANRPANTTYCITVTVVDPTDGRESSPVVPFVQLTTLKDPVPSVPAGTLVVTPR